MEATTSKFHTVGIYYKKKDLQIYKIRNICPARNIGSTKILHEIMDGIILVSACVHIDSIVT